jgi:hypothetical protein
MVAATFLSLAASVSAKVVYTYVKNPSLSIDGSDAIGANGSPTFTSQSVRKLEIDQQANLLYATAEFGGEARIYKFDLNGISQPFSALAPSTMVKPVNFGLGYEIGLDNSNTSTHGRFYTVNTTFPAEELPGWLPSGAAIPGFPILKFPELNPCGVAVSPKTGNLWLASAKVFGNTESATGSIREMTPDGVLTGKAYFPHVSDGMCELKVDTNDTIYFNSYYGGGAYAYGGRTFKIESNGELHPGPLDGAEGVGMAIDYSNNDVFVMSNGGVGQYDADGGFDGSFGAPGLEGPAGITVDEDTHDVYLAAGSQIVKFERTSPRTVPTAKTAPADITPTSAVLNGVVNADGIDTTNCRFEWSEGEDFGYGNSVPCVEGNIFAAASGDHAVHAEIGGLTKGTEYHFRVAASNANGFVSRGISYSFKASSKPTVSDVTASNVGTVGTSLDGEVVPNGSDTLFHFEWGPEENVYTHSIPVSPEGRLATTKNAQIIHTFVTGLSSGATYHFRLVAKNDAGTTVSGDHEFRTFNKDPGVDGCANAHVRQQTGARLLLDCRAYELASASDTGGYDVESDIVPGQAPLVSRPGAKERLLYSLHYGSIPGAQGSPTNFGHDPYVATRGSDGWSTRYVGLPADGMADPESFGSPLLGTDGSLSVFAFGGADICAPCFADGSTNVPLRLADGSLVKGMQGSLNPAANPEEEVVKPLSADGSHFVFGTKAPFETLGKTEGSIYDRSLPTGQTQVVSTLPNGSAIAGGEVGELDISSDGSRIVVGKKVGIDAKGNEYWHLYMHLGSSPNSADLTPGTTTGALFGGMTASGDRVFFTTKDQLLAGDTDNSADIYDAEVSAGGAVTLELVSVEESGPSNTDACTPPGEWNTVSGGPDCSVVALAGGAGVGAADGTLYFLSPEQLDGPTKGIAGEPNLFVARPGSSPRFVALLDNSNAKPPPPPPNRPVANPIFGGSFGSPEAMTVDPSSGDLYIVERSTGKLARVTSAGTPDEFSSLGTNKISGFTFNSPSAAQVAVDNGTTSPLKGDFYVAPGGSKVKVYAPSGELLGELTGSGTPLTKEDQEPPPKAPAFGQACGVAVDPNNGDVYIGDSVKQVVWRLHPVSSTPAITDANYTAKGIQLSYNPCAVGVDSIGDVYASGGSGPVKQFDASSFAVSPLPEPPGVQFDAASNAIAVDPVTNELYVDEGPQISVFSAIGGAALTTFGLEKVAGSRGVAVNPSTHHAYAANGSSIVEFGYEPIPYQPIDTPAVLHAVRQAGVHDYSDFQVSTNGDFALFSTFVPVTGYAVDGHPEIYRYDAVTKELDCVSCPPTLATATSNATLPPYGLGLSDDGRVFFTSSEQLVLRDTNGKRDAYEWESGSLQLISDGIGTTDSSLLSVSPDGTDAYFFTREVLADEDHNGNSVKIYDARSGGGFPSTPAKVPCSASDECHGAGTRAPGPPDIKTVTSASLPPRHAQLTCHKGQVKRHGRCVKPKRHQKHHRRHG